VKKKAKRPPRRKWWEISSPPSSAALAKLMEEHPGKFADGAFWLSGEHREWFEAFYQVDKLRDQSALVALIAPHVPEPVRPAFNDFFARNEIRRKPRRGRPVTPAYDRTGPDAWLEIACEDVQERVDGGSSVARAIQDARKLGVVTIPFATLKNAYLKKRRSTVVMKKRRAPR